MLGDALKYWQEGVRSLEPGCRWWDGKDYLCPVKPAGNESTWLFLRSASICSAEPWSPSWLQMRVRSRTRPLTERIPPVRLLLHPLLLDLLWEAASV